ncbi:MAG: amidohydrolase family protein [Tissierellia bacterium]|nr:amidohydrolase family protein [Tissierellia bacterium]
MKRIFLSGQSLFLLLIIILILYPLPIPSIAESHQYDIVIKNGTIYNPSTDHQLSGYNIGIRAEKIVRITKENISGKEEIDATGLIVSPGFIDLISYDPNSVGIRLKVLDGVTTNLAMHGGTEDAEKWYRGWEKAGVLTNFGASSFITRMRWPIVGYGVDAEMSDPKDIEKLVESVRKNIEAGALGISFSFEYVPGIKHEVVPLLQLAKEYNIPTFYHLRYSDKDRGLEGVKEVIDYGKKTGAIIHIMHINSTGGTFHMEEALNMINEAREEGLDITACVYPYDFWATYINSARFRPGWQERYNITYEDLQIGGTDIRISEDTFEKYRTQRILVAAHGSLPEEELILALQDPHIMIGSDTIIEPSLNNHPRGAGTYSRLFGRYVREKQVLSIMDAIKKVSYLPAKRMESVAPAMKYKGRIEIGADADITIFNPNTIIDKATVKDPALPSVGVEYVIINGVIVKDEEGIVENVSPGKPIRSYFVDKIPDKLPIEYSMVLNQGKEENWVYAYKIDGQTYLSLEEVFDALNIIVEDSKDGKIKIGNILDIEIGSRKAKLGENEILLDKEPIIYKSGVYIADSDLGKILESNYSVELKDNGIKLDYIGAKDKGIGSFAYNKASDQKDREGIGPYIGSYGFSIITILLVFVILRKDR